MTDETIHDRLAIRDVIENWVLHRDGGDWDAFVDVWHPGAVMVATWKHSSATDFMAASREAWNKGVDVLHQLSGSTIAIAGARAVAQTRMTISQRAMVDSHLVDVTCHGRFYDFFERQGGRWGIVRRQPIYERDRLDPVDPAIRLVLDEEVLARFPTGYRHLAYLQTQLGFDVKTDLPGRRGPEVAQLYADGDAWLQSGRLPTDPAAP